MALPAVIDQIIAIVRGTAPGGDVDSFVCVSDGGGPTATLEETAASAPPGTFDVRVLRHPIDDGEACPASSPRRRVEIAVDVAMPGYVGTDIIRGEMVRGRIVEVITDALHTPTNRAAGIDAILVGQSEDEVIGDQGGEAVITHIPATVLYH